MPDFLDVLAADAQATVESGYYECSVATNAAEASLKRAVFQNKGSAVITEIKAASPSKGTIRREFSPSQIAQSMVQGGATAISVLTEPKHFNGSLDNIAAVRQDVHVPVLMKDIIVSPRQLDAASKLGANAVLLIQAIFDRGYCTIELTEMVAKAHSKGLEVLLETHGTAEFVRCAKTKADLLGINNRSLATLNVDLNVTKTVLRECHHDGKLIVSESGVSNPADVKFLRECGADAFLVGGVVMAADNVEEKVRELVNAK